MNTKEYTHCYHAYPAMMIPQIARRLINTFGNSHGGLLFDPYCGSGTTLVEGVLSGYNVIGTDINPLAVLLSRAKCSVPNINVIRAALKLITRIITTDSFTPKCVPDFKNINFWFTSRTIKDLAILKEVIYNSTSDLDALNFLLVAYSETVRESSLTKTSEFKLVRKKLKNLTEFQPPVFKIFLSKVNRNLSGLENYKSEMNRRNLIGSFSVCSFNTVEGIPEDRIKSNSVDIIVTSPPYGDSPTTVAYGQYSRLSSQWLGFEDSFAIDKKLMGGRRIKALRRFDYAPLDAIIMRIAYDNESRAKTVAAFYEELESSIINISRVVKPLGYACFVLSNRRVHGNILPTDGVVSEFFHRCGFHEVEKFTRNIPNKRMPHRNSPTNIPGIVDSTMSTESILVMQKMKSN